MMVRLALRLLILLLLPFSLAAQEHPSGPLGSALVDEAGMLWVRTARGWERRMDGLPTRQVYPFDQPRPLRLTGVSSAPGGTFLLTSSTELFRGRPGDWQRVVSRDRLGTYAYLTTGAAHPRESETIALGTSFHGLFLSDDGGESWKDLSDRLPSLLRGAGYMEEIGSLTFDRSGESLYLLSNFGASLLRLEISGGSDSPARSVALPPEIERGRMLHRAADGALVLSGEVAGTEELAAYELATEGWVRRGEEPHPAAVGELSDSERSRRALAADKRGIYIPILQARGDELERHIEFAKRHDINAFVMDFKDDWGRITFDAELPMARRVGSRRAYLHLDELVQRLEEAEIYLIGRVVVFKDRELHGYAEGRYAIRDRKNGGLWGVPLSPPEVEGEPTEETLREHWVDPYSQDVWEYNVSLAEELERRGVDEIQFDYIRFPSDGPVDRMSFPHGRKGMGKEEALESFLTMARERLTLPISVDVFGFNGYYEMDYLGQNIAMISRKVDVISPMLYPSHFAREFLGELPYLDRARAIYENGSSRARRIADNRAIIRPYIQAFLVGGELEMEESEYRRYLEEQVSGARAGNASGHLLWNNSGRYYMVE
ncbi:MAG: putative glycoside hydrolase [Alkalispirochaetaceae bacterium]